jgi:hypothetical protein
MKCRSSSCQSTPPATGAPPGRWFIIVFVMYETVNPAPLIAWRRSGCLRMLSFDISECVPMRSAVDPLWDGTYPERCAGGLPSRISCSFRRSSASLRSAAVDTSSLPFSRSRIMNLAAPFSSELTGNDKSSFSIAHARSTACATDRWTSPEAPSMWTI